MKVSILGVRGSRPVSSHNMMHYGGNTTSFRIDIDGIPPIFVDGGTGLYEEGIRLASQPGPLRIYMLVTHTHWDHILSYPLFEPFYRQDCEVTFFAPVSEKADFPRLIRGQHHDRTFPRSFNEITAHIEYRSFSGGEKFKLDGATISAFRLNHPGITIGWRIEHDERAVCIITDNAPVENNYLGEGMRERAAADPQAFEKEFNDSLTDFILGADLVIYDTHFDEAGIKNRRHWGHSTPQTATAFALEAGVRHLLLHHHAPEDTDFMVDRKLDEARSIAGEQNLVVEAAAEGMVLWL